MLILGSKTGWQLGQMGKYFPKPFAEIKLGFIGTAANPYEDKPWFYDELKQLKQIGFQIFDIEIENKTQGELRTAFADMDGVFVSGGNTYYLLHHARQSGFDVIAKEILARNGFYIGSSAGALLAGPTIDLARRLDNPEVVEMTDFTGLGLIDFCIMPHLGVEKYDPTIRVILDEWKNANFKIVGLTDQQAVIIKGNLIEYVTS